MEHTDNLQVNRGAGVDGDRLVKFFDICVPVETCNLRCHYCYITQKRLFAKSLPKFSYGPREFAKALAVDRLGGLCMLNFCGGGETLLPPEMPEYVEAALSAGHYVMVVTNGTVGKSFERLSKLPKEYLDRLFFKFSYHFLELKSRNLTDQFFANVKMMRDAGASFTVEATPTDELVPYIDEMKRRTMEEVGAWCHLTVPRSEKDMSRIPLMTKMSQEEFYQTWKVFNSALFEYKFSVFGKKTMNFCYAGKWSYLLDMSSGMLMQCYGGCGIQNLYENMGRPLREVPIGHFCQMPHCFNSHAFHAFGDVPAVAAPSHAILRNRVCADGTEWLKPRMKRFMMQNMGSNNSPYSLPMKMLADAYVPLYAAGRIAKRLIGK